MAAADGLPRFIVIKPRLSEYLRYVGEPANRRGRISGSGNINVADPSLTIAVERAQTDSSLVHFRFVHSNKYWRKESPTSSVVLATADQPDENRSSESCTLIRPIIWNNTYVFQHYDLNSRYFRIQNGTLDVILHHNSDIELASWFDVIDWDTIVVLPRFVTFKGSNDMYLRNVVINRNNFLQFSSDDGNEEAAAYEVISLNDGRIRIKSLFDNRFWRRSPNWIWTDSNDTVGNDINTVFWPVKVNNKTIALRNAGNNRFCCLLTADGNRECLNAAVNTITSEARLIVEELVLDRSIFNVRYRLEDARIFDEKATLAGFGSALNESEKEASFTLTIGYEDSSSFSFSNSLSIMAGVTTSITTGFPRIAEGKIEVSTEITKSFEWERTTIETKTVQAEYLVVVPPKSRVIVKFVATEGKCSVPFSYTQRDRSSRDGNFVTSQRTDGVFTGVNYYSFHFEKPEIEPL